MNNNILEIDLLDENGLTLNDENIIQERKKTAGKPRLYEEGSNARYKQMGYFKKYSKEYAAKNIKIIIQCDLCGTMSNRLCLNIHKKSNKCKKLFKLKNELLLL